MSSSSIHNEDRPLIANKASSSDHPKSISSFTSNTIKTLSVIRVALGASCLLAPRFSCALFQMPIPANMTLMPRFFGIRELILGELLVTAEDKNASDGGRRELKRALWSGVAVDSVDIVSCVVGVAMGQLGRMPAALIAGGGIAGLVLGGLGLRGL